MDFVFFRVFHHEIRFLDPRLLAYRNVQSIVRKAHERRRYGGRKYKMILATIHLIENILLLAHASPYLLPLVVVLAICM